MELPGLGFGIDDCAGEVKSNPRQCIEKARKGSRPHIVSICYEMDSIPKDLRVDALTAVMPFIILGYRYEALAEAIIFAISRLNWDLYSEDSSIASALSKPILHFFDPLMRALRRRFESRFDKKNYGPCSPEMKTMSLSIFSCFLFGMGTNETLGPKLYQDSELTCLPIRLWLTAMAESQPGHCLIEVQECFWACFTTKCVNERAFITTLLEEGGGDVPKITYLSVSELKGNRKIKTTLNLQIRFNMILLLSSKAVHTAALENGAIPALTKAILRLRRLGEECCTASSIILFLKQAEFILGRGDAVRGISEAVEAGLLKVLAESSAFASCSCLRKGDVRSMASLLKSFLARHLVLDSVLDVIISAMSDMSAETLMRLKKSPFAEGWGALRAAALERAVFKRMLDNSNRARGRVAVCDCCWCSSPVPNLKKCAGCKTMMYCSAECQKRDWKENEHKEVCKRSSEVSSKALKINDKYFLGHLAEYDIRRHIAGLDHGTEIDFSGTPDKDLYYAVDYNAVPVTIDIYNLEDLKDRPRLSQEKLDALSSGGMKLVEITYPMGNTPGSFLHVIHDNVHRRAPVLKPAFLQNGWVNGVPEAWFRSKAVWAIPPSVVSDSESEEEDEEDEEESDDEEAVSDTGGSVDGSSEDVSSEATTNDSFKSENSDDPSSDSDSDSEDNDGNTNTGPLPTNIRRTHDEVDAVLGYMLSACGLECDQKSYERLVAVKYSWRDLEKLVTMCQSSETWPFLGSSYRGAPLMIEAPTSS